MTRASSSPGGGEQVAGDLAAAGLRRPISRRCPGEVFGGAARPGQRPAALARGALARPARP